MTKTELSSIVEQEYLTGRQLLKTCLLVIFCIQIIPFIIEPTPYMEWLLLGFTAALHGLYLKSCTALAIGFH